MKIEYLRKVKSNIQTNLGIKIEESGRSLQRQRLHMLTRQIEEEKQEQNTQKLVKLYKKYLALQMIIHSGN